MDTNVGATDSTVRLLLGAITGAIALAVLAGSVTLPDILSPVLGIASLLFLGTATTNRCPAYSLVGLNTCARKSN
jgi:hypothetical protein